MQVKKERVDVVSFRNNFNKILETPYSNEAWTIGVRHENGSNQFKRECGILSVSRCTAGILYFDVVDMDRGAESEEQKRASYWGYCVCVLHYTTLLVS